MSKQMFITLAAAGLLALAGCQSAPTKEAAAGPALSDEAKAALAKAEADVKAASAKAALWTTAEDALKAAQAAAKKGDSAAVVKEARVASEQAALGMGQTAYPPTVIK
jgi:flagellar basal body L-ring protein FlgH